ncbi:APC family permease [Actinocatenispora comari]|uniref:Amino acid permease n=1 Tax=Actinocatenispora comari TaxID=2807577 RepID=A0A8J4EK66_9ACTN|nr:APC family permease [Actinocatenispora comari]GIL26558.1 amino acid permease [Actinocatenispora comari]
MSAATGQTPGSSPVEKRHLRRDIGMIGLLFTGVGSIIGSGWLFGALRASQQAGPAAIFSWLIGGVMIILIGLTFAELGTMFPVTGGVIRFPQYAFGTFASYTLGWITWLAAAVVAPIEVTGVLQYATKYYAGFTEAHAGGVFTLKPVGIVVAIALLAVFCIINVLGVRYFAQINNVLVWWKLVVILLVIVMFLITAFHGANFTSHGFAPAGPSGIFTAIATAGITFSFLGFRQGIELAGETNNPKRNVPFAVIGSVVLTMIIYILLQIAFIAAVNPHDLVTSHGWTDLAFKNDFGPLAAIAEAIGLTWLAVVLYIDAIVSPGDTGLIYTAVTSRLGYVTARNGNAPAGIAKLTKTGVPWVSTIITFVLGVIFLLPFPSWQQLVGLVTSATVLSFGSGPLVWAAMRKEMPDRKRPFRIPGGHVIPVLAFYSSNLIVFWAGWDTNWKFFVAIIVGLILLAVFQATGQIKSVGGLDFKHGYWTLIWLAGLAIVSFVGSMINKGAGDSWLIWGFVACAVLTAVIYWLGWSTRMSKQRMEEMIEQTPHDEVAVEEAGATA